MARSVVPLNNTQVQQVKPKDKLYKIADGGGLQLRVKPRGAKSWLFDYFKPITKKRSSMGFGTYPEVSLAQARKKRDDARELLAQEIDPKEYKDDQFRYKQLAEKHTYNSVATDLLKNISQIEHSRHRSETSFMLNLISGIVAY